MRTIVTIMNILVLIRMLITVSFSSSLRSPYCIAVLSITPTTLKRSSASIFVRTQREACTTSLVGPAEICQFTAQKAKVLLRTSSMIFFGTPQDNNNRSEAHVLAVSRPENTQISTQLAEI